MRLDQATAGRLAPKARSVLRACDRRGGEERYGECQNCNAAARLDGRLLCPDCTRLPAVRRRFPRVRRRGGLEPAEREERVRRYARLAAARLPLVPWDEPEEKGHEGGDGDVRVL